MVEFEWSTDQLITSCVTQIFRLNLGRHQAKDAHWALVSRYNSFGFLPGVLLAGFK